MQQTRQQILDAARELFAKHSYDDVKIDDIADRADLGRATLYNHFASKEDIYFEIGIQGLRIIFKKLKMLITSKHSGLDQIIKLSEIYLRYLFEQPLDHEIMRHFLFTTNKAGIDPEETLKKLELGEEMVNPSDKIRAKYLQEILVSEIIWKDVIERGFKDGSIHHNLNADQLLHFLFMIISGIVDRVHLAKISLQKVNLSIERIIKSTIDLIRKDLARN